MLHVFLGTDREKASRTMGALATQTAGHIIRISDGNPPADLAAALQEGTSMFAVARAVILDSVFSNEDMRLVLLAALPTLAASADHFFILEEKVDADTKKKLQKYAETIEIFDALKSARGGKKEYPTVFKLADYLKKADRKNLWVSYQRELAQGNAPEAVHGVLFWGAKQFLLGARAAKDVERGRKLVATLAELPHESRRRGEEMEYALERFILSS